MGEGGKRVGKHAAPRWRGGLARLLREERRAGDAPQALSQRRAGVRRRLRKPMARVRKRKSPPRLPNVDVGLVESSCCHQWGICSIRPV